MENNKPILKLKTSKGIFWGFSKKHNNEITVPNRIKINGMSVKVSKLYKSGWITGYEAKYFKSHKLSISNVV